MQLCQAAKIGLMEKAIFSREIKMPSTKESKTSSLETPTNSLAAATSLLETTMLSKEIATMPLEMETA